MFHGVCGHKDARAVKFDNGISFERIGNAHGVGESGAASALNSEAKASGRGCFLLREHVLECDGCFRRESNHGNTLTDLVSFAIDFPGIEEGFYLVTCTSFDVAKRAPAVAISDWAASMSPGVSSTPRQASVRRVVGKCSLRASRTVNLTQ